MEYPISLTVEEISVIRQSLDVIQIQGKNAKSIANLQDKFDEAIFNIQFTFQTEEAKKQEELQKIINKEGNIKLKS